MTERSRRLDWEACYNVRDLGGYPLAEGRETRWGALVRADTLCRLTPAGRTALVSYGVRSVIDLRSPKEIANGGEHPIAGRDGHGIAYRNVPLIDPLTEEALRESASSEDAYRILLDGCRDRFAEAVRAVANAPEGGVVVHCAAGRDRTGLACALLLSLAGVPAAVIAEDYALSDLGLRALWDEWLKDATDPEVRARRAARLVSRPEIMAAALAHVAERYGGVSGYLAGVSAEEQALLRHRLVA